MKSPIIGLMVNVAKFLTLAACQICLDKQCKPRSDRLLLKKQFYQGLLGLFAIQTRILIALKHIIAKLKIRDKGVIYLYQ